MISHPLSLPRKVVFLYDHGGRDAIEGAKEGWVGKINWNFKFSISYKQLNYMYGIRIKQLSIASPAGEREKLSEGNG